MNESNKNKSNNNLGLDLKIEKIERNQDSIKKENTITNIYKSSPNNLKDFISNLKKFNFKSAFDHKGSKSFLKSKGKALEKICLNENLLEENKIKKKHNKKRKNCSCKIINKKLKKEIKNKYTHEQKEKKKEYKNLLNVKDSDIYITNYFNKDIKVEKKIPKKFCSQMELNMFKDKTLNKLQPIKWKTEKENYINTDYTYKHKNSSESDSTLFNLISEIKHS